MKWFDLDEREFPLTSIKHVFRLPHGKARDILLITVQACKSNSEPLFNVGSSQRILRVIKILRILKILRLLKGVKVVE
jgi:hypothetical protein